VGGELVPGAEIELRVDQILIEDATGTMCCLQFEALGIDRCAVPLAVMYVDHNTLQLDTKDMESHRYLQTFSERYGLHYSRPGNGISHYLHLERFAQPGARGLPHICRRRGRCARDRCRGAGGRSRNGGLPVHDVVP
jgi:aconitate hydratase